MPAGGNMGCWIDAGDCTCMGIICVIWIGMSSGWGPRIAYCA
eukprot:CAMPEP_0172202580 /NCGR_PEP_ID=MMETSP1050-20130122/30748_1 /TAXON_ID=233186 /ORGANISM="Cryptomonas curvata, Strain CCAP979/52" /LENGTH=41 /DNA_ID= /DNA_START= /DNA_END= /DNA_ORIENTATION=